VIATTGARPAWWPPDLLAQAGNMTPWPQPFLLTQAALARPVPLPIEAQVTGPPAPRVSQCLRGLGLIVAAPAEDAAR